MKRIEPENRDRTSNFTDGTTPIEFTPDGHTIHARFANGAQLVMRLGGFKAEGERLDLGSCPVRFEGGMGWVVAGSFGKIVANPPWLVDGLVIDPAPGGNPSAQIRNFLDCIKARNAPTANSRVMRSFHIACHAAAMSFILGRKLTINPATESFLNDDKANHLRRRARRAPLHA